MEEQYIQQLTKKYDEAMELANLAHLALLRGNPEEAQQLHRQAFEIEREAALEGARIMFEPSRSVLLHSAASLALVCGEIREAEKLAALGLAGNPPEEILKELRDIFKQIFDVLIE